MPLRRAAALPQVGESGEPEEAAESADNTPEGGEGGSLLDLLTEELAREVASPVITTISIYNTI